MTDPAAAPHGGESIVELIARARQWLAGRSAAAGSTLAVTHAGFIHAAIIATLDAPAHAFWRIEIAPLSHVLEAHDSAWTLISITNRQEIDSGTA
jgi:broad specificity phosphatase PhoE